MKWCSKERMTCLAVLLFACGAWAQATSVLPIERRMLFNAWTNFPSGSYYSAQWTHTGPVAATFPPSRVRLLAGTNHVHTSGGGSNIWNLVACRTGSSDQLGSEVPPVSYTTPLVLSTNWHASLQNTLDAKIETPYYPEGIGTLYFDAINVTPSDPTQLTVEIATNMVDHIYAGGPTNVMLPQESEQYTYNWVFLTNLTLSAATSAEFTRYYQRLNYRQAAKIRISRSGTLPAYANIDNAFTAVDNICVSPPPADVVISRPHVVFEPGHPSVGSNAAIRCYVDNLDQNVRTDWHSRTVTVRYRWRYLDQMTNAWTNVVMTCVNEGDGQGNGELYSAPLPAHPQVGDLEYYFVCAFEGFRYNHYDYTQTGGTFPSEWLSPRTLRGSELEPGGREFYTRLRPFSSQYGAVYLVTDAPEGPFEMTLVGDDEWRGLIPLNNGSITNVSWCFKGVDKYVPGSLVFDTNPVYWAEQAQASVEYVPYGGVCAVRFPSSRNSVLVDNSGYLEIVFNTRTLKYMASRAEYQNFNAWPAPPNTFTESYGQAPKQKFLNTFNAWPTNESPGQAEYFIGSMTTHTNYTREPYPTYNGWLSGSSKYVRDRFEADDLNKPFGALKFQNVALRLKGGDSTLGLGYVHNMPNTRPDGLQDVSFKCRLGQPASRFDIAYYKSGFTNLNYCVRVNVKADAGMSPENPSVSIIGYFVDPDKFYEYRVTQITNSANLTTSGDTKVRHELWKWVGGVPALLKSSIRTESFNISSLMADCELRLFNASASATVIHCKFGTINDTLVHTDSSSPIQYGSFGFLSADCRAGFSNVRTQPTTTDAAVTGATTTILDGASSPTFNGQIQNWYTPAGRFEGLTSISPYGIYSVIPLQKLGVYLQASSNDSLEAPAAPGTTNWVKISEVTATSFGYTSHTVPVKMWRSDFVMLQVMGRGDLLDVDIAVDELKVLPWRGQESSDSGGAENEDWIATEAWVVSNTTSEAHVVQLVHSRADPAEDQAIRSLLLTNGMGLLEFDYKVLSGPAKLSVQYAPEWDSGDWREIQGLIVSNAMASYAHALFYLGTNMPGYMRVLNARETGYTNAIVEINNIIAWDEPYVEDTSWRVYNAKITDTDKMRVMLDDTKACFLNNNATAETDPSQILYDPYVKSPRLANGLGKLWFMARAYSNNQNATVSIYVSTNGWNPPDSQWKWVQDVVASNTLYQTYAYAPQDGRSYDAVKLVTGTAPTTKRVCLEEVVVSEPVFPGFKIVNVKALCKDNDGTYSETRFQPLDSDEVGVEAQISNIQLNPTNIEMYVSYYVGTNVWGIGNWPTGQTVTKRMYPTVENPNIYQTSPFDDIPFVEKDQVVQYYVWATYEDEKGLPLRVQQEKFVTPSWYYPIDLNVTYASQGWASYYIVYSVPLGAVWLNEINAVDTKTNNVRHYGENQYIEIAVPAGVDLAGWKLDLVDNLGNTETITIPPGLPEQAPVQNGYAFFVVGEDLRTRDTSVPALPKLDFGYMYLSWFMPAISPGGIRLRRPLGMYEQAAAYDWNPSWPGFSGAEWAAEDPEGKFYYVGREHNYGSLSVTNGIGASTNDWTFPLAWTPGLPNIGQTVQNADILAPGVSNVVIVSSMNTLYGTQKGARISPISLKVRKGSDTNILYVADDWYRIKSITVNGAEQLAPGEELETKNLLLLGVQTNTSVSVDVGLRSDVDGLGLSGEVLNWLLSFGDLPLAPTYYYGRELTLMERFWLNANPTVTNRLEGGISKMEKIAETNYYGGVEQVYETNYYLTVWLAMNGQNVTNLQGNSVFKVEAKQRLVDPAWSMLSQYALTTNSFDVDHSSRVFLINPFRRQLIGWDPKNILFHWVIEMEDPRFIVQELVNEAP